VNPLSGPYDDASSPSTFGGPNRWGSTGASQSFAAFVSANSPPTFTSAPPDTRISSSFNYAITTSDPNGNAVTLSAPSLPDFLTLTPGTSGSATLGTNRALTLADAGEHRIELIADDGQATANTTPQTFILNVFHHSPSVILNEYNAVASDEFFNGGDLSADGDLGAASADQYFGRVPGNGGNWFELVVTGDGGASTVDLRGWTIEIGTSSGGEFRTSEILQLSQSDEWAAVPAGTILTFIEKNSANGGLDTGLRLRDNLTSTGEAWSNIWLGDPDLLVYTDEATNGYTLDGGTVEGIGINQNSTQFLIRNALNQAVFGPAGEGIAPQSGVSSTETFRLQSNPSPAVLPLTESINGNPGYSAASADSTFGQPNRWQDAFNNQVVQTFSAYIVTPTPYENWANTFGLTGDAALGSADPDLDGRSNLAEYAFGGNPTAIDAAPAATLSHDGTEATWQFVRRDDDSLDLRLQRSTDLSDWSTVSPVSRSHNAHPSLNGFVLETITVSPDPENGREFFRVLVNEAQ
jgi:hypothetical protein